MNGLELWKTDGTEAGTVKVRDIRSDSLRPKSMTAVEDTVFFISRDREARRRELWKSDGTGAGTVMVKDIGPGGRLDGPLLGLDVERALYFWADDGKHGLEPWTSDGTSIGTTMVMDLLPLARRALASAGPRSWREQYSSAPRTLRPESSCGNSDLGSSP